MTPGTVAHQAPLSMEYSPCNSPGQNTGVGSLSLLQVIFPTQGLNPGLPHCSWILYQLSHKGSPRIVEWVVYPFSRGSAWPRDQIGVSCIAGGFFTNWALRDWDNPKDFLKFPHCPLEGSTVPVEYHRNQKDLLQAKLPGLPFPSPGHLANPGIKTRSPALQPDSLPSEQPGKSLKV